MTIRLTIFWIGDDGIIVDTDPTEEIFTGYEFVLDVIARLDSITPRRYELRSPLGHVDTADRQEFLKACAFSVIHVHRSFEFDLVVHPSRERYTLAALSQDPTGFSFGVDESRHAGDRMWEIVQGLAPVYRERGVVLATSIAGPI